MVDSPRPRGRVPTALAVVVAAVLVVLIGVAGFVVVNNARRVTTGPVPSAILPTARDTTLGGWIQLMHYKVGVLERRYRPRRDSLRAPSPAQESLISQCDSGLAAVGTLLAGMDTLRGQREQQSAQAAVKGAYAGARELVGRFMRSVNSKASLDEDSLDQELKKLISD